MQSNINFLLQHAVSKKASDLHLSANLAPILRIDGALHAMDLPVITEGILAQFLPQLLNTQELETFAQTMEIDTTYSFTMQQRFRVHGYLQQRGLGLALRVIQHPTPTLASLQLPEIFSTLCEKAHGLILITGPTGSGKSSSLAAMIQHINATQRKHIVTLEDPIEFLHVSNQCLISQMAVKSHTKSFNRGLRAALRQDPDVIMLGELRDLTTIRLALTAAETGHLVLATLHTATAVKAIDRMIDVFPGNEKDCVRKLLAESLTAVIAQKLHPKLGGGRQAEFESLFCTPAARNLIREGKTTQIYPTIIAS